MKQLIVGSIVFILVTLGGNSRSFGDQISAPRGELRIVDMHPGNWASVTLHVFEHLMELDKNGEASPTSGDQLAVA